MFGLVLLIMKRYCYCYATATATATAAATTTDHLIGATEARAQAYVGLQGTHILCLAKTVLTASNARSGVPIPEKWVVYV